MMNELECALIEQRWERAAFLLENGDDSIGEGMAREALAELLRSNEKAPVGKPRKILPSNQPSLIELMMVNELQELAKVSDQKEAEKLVIAKKYMVGRSTLEEVEKKYREHHPHLLK